MKTQPLFASLQTKREIHGPTDNRAQLRKATAGPSALRTFGIHHGFCRPQCRRMPRDPIGTKHVINRRNTQATLASWSCAINQTQNDISTQTELTATSHKFPPLQHGQIVLVWKCCERNLCQRNPADHRHFKGTGENTEGWLVAVS